MGVANAYNIGIEASRGEFIAFLSHDDLWTPDKLSAQAGYLVEHPGVQYTVARVKFFLEPGCSFPSSLRKEVLEGDYPARIMETLVARRQVFDRVGMLDPQVSPVDDVDWFARANDLGVSMAVIEKVLLLKRIHDKNTSLNSPKNTENLFTALRRSAVRKRELEKG
jgi:glycosyltransferase involved in cell wall biosynthesis